VAVNPQESRKEKKEKVKKMTCKTPFEKAPETDHHPEELFHDGTGIEFGVKDKRGVQRKKECGKESTPRVKTFFGKEIEEQKHEKSEKDREEPHEGDTGTEEGKERPEHIGLKGAGVRSNAKGKGLVVDTQVILFAKGKRRVHHIHGKAGMNNFIILRTRQGKIGGGKISKKRETDPQKTEMNNPHLFSISSISKIKSPS